MSSIEHERTTISTPSRRSAAIDHVRSLYDAFDSLADYDRARLLRQYAFGRIMLAATADSRLPRGILAEPLTRIFEAFDREEGGVWCSGAAWILMRLYLEAGFRSWRYTYGAGSPATHAVTLVEAAGHVYVQDAYFNIDYVSEAGEPIPFFELLKGLRTGRAPRLRQDPGSRKGFFASRDNTRKWVRPELHAAITCEKMLAEHVVCRVPMTFDAYAKSYFRAAATADWLAAAGYPDDWSFLMLHPRPGQKFVTARGDTCDESLSPDHEMALSVTRAIATPRAAFRQPADGTFSAVAARLAFLEDRVHGLQRELAEKVAQAQQLRRKNGRLLEKLTRTREAFRVKLDRARAKSRRLYGGSDVARDKEDPANE